MKKTLFLILRPPEGPLPSLVGEYGKGSGILLLEDGMLHAVKEDALQRLMNTGMELFALRDSVNARGFLEGFPGNVKLVDAADVPRIIMEDYETALTV